ncbi:MAG: serine hydrolase [Clostridia bacterium]|nr:serine hydrolase [Clostridia bacterium]
MNRISPDEAGVSSRSLSNFFEALDALPFDMHSVIMIRHGKVLLETYYEPYNKETLHRMFSVTKSFVGIAIGHLAYEKKIDLDAPITSYFPEYPTEYEYTKQTTIRNMLMMRSPHEKTTYKEDLTKNWVESYFTVKSTHTPGTVFSYDTSASHVLVALVEKITGMDLMDYLRGAFLDEIGFSKEAYCLKDPFGTSVGGSGLMATPMDLAKTALFVMNGGKHEGKQLTDGVFLEKATSFLSRTDTRGGFVDEKQGYGMQFWRTRNNGFMFYGIGGQLALCLPDKDFIMVTTADALGYQGGVQSILNIFWRDVYSKLDEPCCCGKYTLEKLLENRKIMPVRGSANTFDGEFVFDENVMGLKNLHVVSDENGGKIDYTNETGSHTLEFKTDGFHSGKFPYYNCDCITSGAWDGENILIVKSRLIGEMVGAVTMELYFTSDGVTISARKTEGTFFKEFNGITQGRRK